MAWICGSRKSGHPLEDARTRRPSGVQARERGDDGRLAPAGSRRGDEERRTESFCVVIASPLKTGIALTPALKACLTIVMSVTVSAASTSASAARPVTMTCCMAGAWRAFPARGRCRASRISRT